MCNEPRTAAASPHVSRAVYPPHEGNAAWRDATPHPLGLESTRAHISSNSPLLCRLNGRDGTANLWNSSYASSSRTSSRASCTARTSTTTTRRRQTPSSCCSASPSCGWPMWIKHRRCPRCVCVCPGGGGGGWAWGRPRPKTAGTEFLLQRFPNLRVWDVWQQRGSIGSCRSNKAGSAAAALLALGCV